MLDTDPTCTALTAAAPLDTETAVAVAVAVCLVLLLRQLQEFVDGSDGAIATAYYAYPFSLQKQKN